MPEEKAVKKGILDYYFEEPIQENTVLIEALGKWTRGNLVYVVQELASGKYGDLRLFFSVNDDTLEYSRSFFESRGINEIEYVIAGSGRYRRVLSFVEYLINEADFPSYWIKKDGQKYVNIWHGTPLKKLGTAREDQLVHDEGNHQRNMIMADYLLCPNEHTENVFLDDFYIRDFYEGKIIMKGYPRTAALFDPPETEMESDKRCIAYMPTWREGAESKKQISDMLDFLQEIDGELPEDSVLYVNLHHKIENVIDYDIYSNIKPFPAGMDTYEFLRNVDVLVTDYSSIMFDFAVTGRKIILYCSDIESYAGSRGMYFDITELPFPIVKTTDGLVQEMADSRIEYDDSQFLKKFCRCDSKTNTEALCRAWIEEDFSEANVIECRRTETAAAVLYSDALEKGQMTDMLYAWHKVHRDDDYHGYISYKNSLVRENTDSAYPLLDEARNIGCKSRQLYRGAQKTAKKSYENGELKFKKYLEAARSAFETEENRRFASCRFDLLVMCDCLDYEAVLGASFFSGKKAIILNDRLLAAARDDDNLRAAVKHFSSRSDMIFAFDKGTAGMSRRLFRLGLGRRITLLADAGDFEKHMLELLK